jgi:hypothetical protein
MDGSNYNPERNSTNSETSPVTERWIQAMPTPLKPYWQQMRGFLQDGSFFVNALKNNGYTLEELSVELFYWYGSGYGPWSGYPMYERVAGFLLSETPTHHLIRVISSTPLTDTHMEGIARYFSNRTFWDNHKDEAKSLSKQLLQDIFNYLVRIDDEQKLEQFKFFFRSIHDFTLDEGGS